jgi:hypothetical protein
MKRIFLAAGFAVTAMVGLMVGAAAAAPIPLGSIGSLVNPVIDQAQGAVVAWVATGVVSACFAALTWIGGKIGFRVVDRLNRATIQESAERYTNTIIDQIQLRYLASASGVPDLSDLVLGGIGYIKAGNSGTVKAGGFTDSKLGDYVTGAMNDKLTKVLAKAGAPVAGR